MKLLPLLCVLNLLISAVVFADTPEGATEKLMAIQEQMKATVKKIHTANVALRGRTGERRGSGSGVIVSKDGIILSAAHVTAGHETMEVLFNDGSKAKAKVLGSDAKRDIAMLQITTEQEADWPFTGIGDSSAIEVSDLVISLGHAGGFDAKRKAPVRFGRIHANRDGGYISSDCQMIGGDSGGGLFTLDGKLIAIHSNIGSSLAANNHAPVNVATDSWDRLLAGENVTGEWKSRSERRRRPAPKSDKDEPKQESKPKEETEPKEELEDSGAEETEPEQKKVTKPKPQEKEEPKSESRSGKKPNNEKVTLKGLDDKKFREDAIAFFKEMRELNRDKPADKRTKVKSVQLRKLLVDAGANAEQVKELKDQQVSRLLSSAFAAQRAEQYKERRRLSNETSKKLNKQYKEFVAGFRPAIAKVKGTTVALFDDEESSEPITLGTIVDPRGFILSKHSELKDAYQLTCEVNEDRLDAEILKVWQDHDLALLQVPNDELTAIQWSTTEALEEGTLLVAPNIDNKDPLAIGVVSVVTRSLSMKNRGFLGITLGKNDKGILVNSVGDKTPAKKAGIKKDDVVTHINGKKTGEVSKFISTVGAIAPGDRVKLKLLRDGEELKLNVKLGERPNQSFESTRTRRMNEMSGERSELRDGFPSIIQTDLAVQPGQQGGPIVTLEGEIIGLNIARAGRIKTYALPSEVILELLEEIDFHRYVNPIAEQIREYGGGLE